jgi:hypothetical protein
MYYQYKLAHYKGNMGHDATSDVVLKDERGKCRLTPKRKCCVGSVLCRCKMAVLVKSAVIWLSRRHIADMSATFPAKCVFKLVRSLMCIQKQDNVMCVF